MKGAPKHLKIMKLTQYQRSGAGDEYEVEKILKVREGKLGKEYLVKWKGWENIADRTWEPEESLEGSKDLLKDLGRKEINKDIDMDSSCIRGSKKKTKSRDVPVLDDSEVNEDFGAKEINDISIDFEELPLSSRRGKKSKYKVEKELKVDEDGDGEVDVDSGEYEIEKILDQKVVLSSI